MLLPHKIPSLMAAAILAMLGPAKADGLVRTLSFKSSSTYSGKPVLLKGDFHQPQGVEKPPLVILLHGCGGLGEVAAKSLASHAGELNRAGFAAFILDSFEPRGIAGGWVCARTSRLASAWGYRARDIGDALRHLTLSEAIDEQNIFIMGQSNGGSVAAIAAEEARIEGLRAAVAFYPWCGAVPTNPQIPLMVLIGEVDEWTPPAECERRESIGNGFELKIYPDAHHSFDLPIAVTSYQGRTVGGNQDAAHDARERTVRFFSRHLAQQKKD